MLLGDYDSGLRYFEFDPETGVYSHHKLEAPRKSWEGYSGNAQLLRSPREGRVLVAQFVLSGEPWFSIGAQKWRLFDPSAVVKHRETFGFLICELTVHQDGRCIRTFRYFRRDWFALIIDPTYDYLDFSLANLPVDFEPHELSSLQRQREDFIAIWSGQYRPDSRS
jgi:hypothetical protein